MSRHSRGDGGNLEPITIGDNIIGWMVPFEGDRRVVFYPVSFDLALGFGFFFFRQTLSFLTNAQSLGL